MLAAIVLLALRCSAASAQALALVGATVIDVNEGRLLSGQTVVVIGNRIHTVGPSRRVKVPNGAKIVDGKGKYVVPGFWDMHAHTERAGDFSGDVQASLYRTQYPLYIANGVTGLREMPQRFEGGADSFRIWQREVMAGARVGPHAVGPSADLTYLGVTDPKDVGRVVDSLRAAGMVFLKLHDEHTGPDLYFTILREARRVGLPVIGHTSPGLVGAAQASDSGQRSIEHMWLNSPCWQEWQTNSAAAEPGCTAMIQAYVRNGTWIVPTMGVLSYYEKGGYLARMQPFLGYLHRREVRALTGSDCDSEWILDGVHRWPDKWGGEGADSTCHRGFALLQEIVWFDGSGLTPLEALQAATLDPAKYLDATDSLGTVEAGKLADLVVLDADPLADIRNVLKIRAVVANGRYFDRAALDALDPQASQLARRFTERPAAWPAAPGTSK